MCLIGHRDVPLVDVALWQKRTELALLGLNISKAMFPSNFKQIFKVLQKRKCELGTLPPTSLERTNDIQLHQNLCGKGVFISHLVH